MASVTAMHHAMTNSVLVLKACLAMICGSLITTELKPCALEVLPQANVEGDVTVIRVHVQTQVFANLVAHHKGVMPIEVRSNTWKESDLIHISGVFPKFCRFFRTMQAAR